MNTYTTADTIKGYEYAADLVKAQLTGNQDQFNELFTQCVTEEPHVAQLALKTVAVIAARSMYVLHAGNAQVAADRLDTDVMGMVMKLRNTPGSE